MGMHAAPAARSRRRRRMTQRRTRVTGKNLESKMAGLQIVSRQQAMTLDLKRYFTGVPCSKGHVSERYTKGTSCCQCMKEHAKAWSNNNKDREAEARAINRHKNIEKIRSRGREKYRKNVDYFRQKNKRYAAKNAERLRERKKEYRERNKDMFAEKMVEFHRRNPGYAKANTAKRRAARKSGTPRWADKEKTLSIYNSCSEGMNVDHIVPLSGKVFGLRVVCGLHWHMNLQVISYSENMAKGAHSWPDMPAYTLDDIEELRANIND